MPRPCQRAISTSTPNCRAANPGLPPVPRSPDNPFLIMFTSGTTGLAKPLLVPIRAILSMAHYVHDLVGLNDADTFWNVADPGWAYGVY